ncbi:NADPH-dependent FMN reductase [Novosphingobium sp. M1R2S20]|uniref:NADPH-dependent FMN reductase n=1 Tax=Novosphingobium rhizovicinum TaxID=3228928 RepID=A0ABV3RBJ5_9SPHN
MPIKICVLVGSLREESYNRQLAEGLIHLPEAREHTFAFADIGALPLYSEEQDNDPPEAVKRLRELVRDSDAILFVTPEYNRSIPGVLKNAIDHGSRPYGQSVWAGKPSAVIGTSIGQIGTALAQSHLRMVLAYLDVPLMDQPEAYIQWKEGLVAQDHTIAESSRDFLANWMSAFFTFIQRHQGG